MHVCGHITFDDLTVTTTWLHEVAENSLLSTGCNPLNGLLAYMQQWTGSKLIRVVIIHNDDVMTAAIASLVTSLTIVYSTVYSDADQRRHQSSASLAFVWVIHRVPVNSPHKWPVTRKMFPFDDFIVCRMYGQTVTQSNAELSMKAKQHILVEWQSNCSFH